MAGFVVLLLWLPWLWHCGVIEARKGGKGEGTEQERNRNRRGDGTEEELEMTDLRLVLV